MGDRGQVKIEFEQWAEKFACNVCGAEGEHRENVTHREECTVTSIGVSKVPDHVQPVNMQGDAPVYLYAHWAGTELPSAVALGLCRDRWDGEYLARCIFSDMIANPTALAGNLSFGIGTSRHGDLGHPLIIVDAHTKTVWFTDPDDENKVLGGPVSFADVVESGLDWPDDGAVTSKRENWKQSEENAQLWALSS